MRKPAPACVRRSGRASVAVVTLALLLTLLSYGATGPALAAPSAPAPRATTGDVGPVVVLGTTDLTWADVLAGADSPDSPPDVREATSTLLAMAGQGEAVSLVARTVGDTSCPADGWLTLGALTRVRATQADRAEQCAWPGAWAQATASAPRTNGATGAGTLARALSLTGTSTGAVGRGAVLALTSPDGAPPATMTWSTLTSTAQAPDLVLVDTTDPEVMAELAPGHVDQPGTAEGGDAVSDAKRMTSLGQAVRALGEQGPPGARVMVLSVSESASPGPQLALLPPGTRTGVGAEPGTGALAGPGGTVRLLRPSSTHQPGLLELTDVGSPLVSLWVGTTLTLGPDHPANQLPHPVLVLPKGPWPAPELGVGAAGQGRLKAEALADQALHARASRLSTVPASLALIATSLACLAACALLLRGTRRAPRPGLAGTLALGALLAPVGVLATNLVPWWRVGASGETPGWVTVAAALGAGTVTALALAALLTGLRRLLPTTASAQASVVALAALAVMVVTIGDGALGARLAFNSPLGMNAVVAGRYYGVNNLAFALGSGALLVAVAATLSVLRPWVGALTARLRPHGDGALQVRLWRWSVVLVVTVLGGATLVADGHWSLGADLGGVLTLLPVLVVLAGLLAGTRPRLWHLLALGVPPAVVALALAYLDLHLNGDTPTTHLGRFAQDLRHGQAGGVLARKAWAVVSPLVSSPLAALALVAGLALLGVVLWWARGEVRKALAGAGPYAWLAQRDDDAPAGALVPAARARGWLRPVLVAALVLVVLESVVNDSGLAMPWFSALSLGPGVVALVCTGLRPDV